MILDEIIAATRKDLAIKKARLPFKELIKRVSESSEPARDFYKSLYDTHSPALIAEIKRASPSSGIINESVDVVAQAKIYEAAGAAAISVLTNKSHFNGDDSLIKKAKEVVSIPILRKDFIIDPYQIYESKLLGADAILLIARLFNPDELKMFVSLAHMIGLESLLEVHNEAELRIALETGAKVIGINARDLDTLKIDKELFGKLAKQVSNDQLLVAESGIETRADVAQVVGFGAKAILVGTALMKVNDVGQKIEELIFR